jgi:hypothetical protein
MMTFRLTICESLFIYFSFVCLPIHCRCRTLLFDTIILNDTYTIGRTSLDEGSARRRNPYVKTHNTHNHGWIRTRNPSTPPARQRRLRPRSHRDRLICEFSMECKGLLICYHLVDIEIETSICAPSFESPLCRRHCQNSIPSVLNVYISFKYLIFLKLCSYK